MRKVTERQSPSPTSTRMKERIYLGSFEIYREYGSDGTTVTLERETLHVMDDKRHIALVETRTDTPTPQKLIRYQFGNHLGSAGLELDDHAQIISYEEYMPYGGTSYQAMRSLTETPKRYRYIGKERDEESGLYYHGARYYAAWLGRWVNCDPVGVKDGANLYCYSRDNPIALFDPGGMQTTHPQEELEQQSIPELHGTPLEEEEQRSIPSEHPAVDNPAPSPSPSRHVEGPTISAIPPEEVHRRELDRIISLDMPPGEAFDYPEAYLPYAVLYGLKQGIYVPLREWVSPTPRLYLDSEGHAREYTGPRDHTDALAALVNLAMFALPALGPARGGAGALAASSAPLGGTGAARNLLMVGAESQAEFSWLTRQSAAGWEATAVNPMRSSAASSFQASGGRFIQGGVEGIGETFTWTHESFPQPLGRTVGAMNAYQARLATVAPGGRMTIITESQELLEMYQAFTGQGTSFRATETLFTPAHPQAGLLPPATSTYVPPGSPVWLLEILRH